MIFYRKITFLRSVKRKIIIVVARTKWHRLSLTNAVVNVMRKQYLRPRKSCAIDLECLAPQNNGEKEHRLSPIVFNLEQDWKHLGFKKKLASHVCQW